MTDDLGGVAETTMQELIVLFKTGHDHDLEETTNKAAGKIGERPGGSLRFMSGWFWSAVQVQEEVKGRF
jgi:hypothetical protein